MIHAQTHLIEVVEMDEPYRWSKTKSDVHAVLHSSITKIIMLFDPLNFLHCLVFCMQLYAALCNFPGRREALQSQ